MNASQQHPHPPVASLSEHLSRRRADPGVPLAEVDEQPEPPEPRVDDFRLSRAEALALARLCERLARSIREQGGTTDVNSASTSDPDTDR